MTPTPTSTRSRATVVVPLVLLTIAVIALGILAYNLLRKKPAGATSSPTAASNGVLETNVSAATNIIKVQKPAKDTNVLVEAKKTDKVATTNTSAVSVATNIAAVPLPVRMTNYFSITNYSEVKVMTTNYFNVTNFVVVPSPAPAVASPPQPPTFSVSVPVTVTIENNLDGQRRTVRRTNEVSAGVTNLPATKPVSAVVPSKSEDYPIYYTYPTKKSAAPAPEHGAVSPPPLRQSAPSPLPPPQPAPTFVATVPTIPYYVPELVPRYSGYYYPPAGPRFVGPYDYGWYDSYDYGPMTVCGLERRSFFGVKFVAGGDHCVRRMSYQYDAGFVGTPRYGRTHSVATSYRTAPGHYSPAAQLGHSRGRTVPGYR